MAIRIDVSKSGGTGYKLCSQNPFKREKWEDAGNVFATMNIVELKRCLNIPSQIKGAARELLRLHRRGRFVNLTDFQWARVKLATGMQLTAREKNALKA